MTPSIGERRQQLDFSARWAAAKWDETAEFLQSQQQCTTGVKAADVIAIDRERNTLVVAEFKDFAHPNIPPSETAAKARDAVSGQLIDALGRKAIDTLAGATFAHDQEGRRSDALQDWTAVLQRGGPKILLLFCIEVPPSQSPAILAWTTKLKQRFSWLGPNVHVIVTSSDRAFSGAGITYSVLAAR